MADHYYSKRPETAHERRSLETVLRGRSYRFVSDSGVFSKQGIDYGSRVLIEAMQLPAQASVLDVGCGYGPIGLAAAALVPEGHVTMVDINERAVQLAIENAERNGVKNVTVKQSDLFAEVKNERFDVILTNPPIRAGKETVHTIFELAYEHLNEGGTLWVVIQKKQGAPSASAKIESLFGHVEEVTKDKGYRILKAKKSF
ncbi:class I SAM-dependent methyltransferase [Paenibacillus sp. SEL3]|jgi:16S rRNA (guanine1207-N2)-methyltransferase|uniref:class I SAM-dependent methyltransferase n=1 Tax=Paenibacillus TaxID=44249 RepID=UPI0003FA82D4|nr:MULTISPECIES: class I SAM-dependent methyltransferase [Paenibacillus]MBO3282693.1 class I SAM-dependent methyltransferase [Paenibacillus polymyxa]MBP1312229.1 16S rRNA (guanine1207-N2)-methyltransferase [Paenibacillus sp. 1182]ODB55205.1 16S rRNA methyltransferase [Paenibacillus polymyxa]UMY54285.1 class I SAM-dependent methyltransferase [Paenibacillus peoriae]